MAFDQSAEEALRQARQYLSFHDLVAQVTGTRPDKRSPCPACGRKGKFGLFTRNGRQLYHCFTSDCKLHDTGDDVQFVQVWIGLPDRKAAFKEFLKLAGVN